MSAFQIKAQLGKLSLKSYGYKVEEMHADVRKNIKLLKAARETHADLPLNLFNAYESAPSEEFRFEIRSLKHRYNQGEALGTIKIKYVKSENQLADILTKPLREHAFVRLRKRLCGW